MSNLWLQRSLSASRALMLWYGDKDEAVNVFLYEPDLFNLPKSDTRLWKHTLTNQTLVPLITIIALKTSHLARLLILPSYVNNLASLGRDAFRRSGPCSPYNWLLVMMNVLIYGCDLCLLPPYLVEVIVLSVCVVKTIEINADSVKRTCSPPTCAHLNLSTQRRHPHPSLTPPTSALFLSVLSGRPSSSSSVFCPASPPPPTCCLHLLNLFAPTQCLLSLSHSCFSTTLTPLFFFLLSLFSLSSLVCPSRRIFLF